MSLVKMLRLWVKRLGKCNQIERKKIATEIAHAKSNTTAIDGNYKGF